MEQLLIMYFRKKYLQHLVKFLFSLLSFQFLFSPQDSAHISPDNFKPPLTMGAQNVQFLFNSHNHFIPGLLVGFLPKAPHLLSDTLHGVGDEDGAEQLLLVVDVIELPLAEGEDGEGLDLPLGLVPARHLLSSVSQPARTIKSAVRSQLLLLSRLLYLPSCSRFYLPCCGPEGEGGGGSLATIMSAVGSIIISEIN